jgi:hypothetical protein
MHFVRILAQICLLVVGLLMETFDAPSMDGRFAERRPLRSD